jgi:nucleotide-binding universal stress UspA family protein
MSPTHSQLGTILCGVDGSEHAGHAARVALTLADGLRTRLTLVYVGPTLTLLPVASLPADVDQGAFVRSAEAARVQAKQAFESLPPELGRSDIGREVRLGEPATVLAELAAERDATVVVVGSRGRGAWRSAALGSVSAELVRLARCPVMVVPVRALEQQTA